jgi:hypothetical protein
MQKKFKDVSFVGVSNEKSDVVKKFVAKMGDKMDYNVAIDEDGKTSVGYLEPFGIGVIPHAFIVDKKGRVVTIDTGYGSNVVIPQIGFDVNAINRELCASLYVGSERLKLAKAAYEEYGDWSREQRTNDVEEPTAPEPARNVPTAINEDDVKPF